MKAPAESLAAGRIAALSSLRDLLIEEREALVARDQIAILDCAERKAARAADLELLLPGAQALQSADASQRGALAALARECRELNAGNGVMVAALRGVVDRALGILRGTPAEDVAVYGPQGLRRGADDGRFAGSA